LKLCIQVFEGKLARPDKYSPPPIPKFHFFPLNSRVIPAMGDINHNQWLREMGLETGNRHGKRKQHDNFWQKRRIFCNPTNHRRLVKLDK